MSTPEKAFLTDWAYIVGNIAIVAIIPILIAFMYHSLKVTRHIDVRIFRGAFWPKYSCHWFITIRHFPFRTHSNCDLLTNISNHAVSDMNPFIVASLVGILCILYTFLGGFEGVVWSDFIQELFYLVAH